MLASKFKLLWFDIEHGALTLYQLPKECQDNIEYIQVLDDRKNFQGIRTVLEVTDGKLVNVCDMHGRTGACSICALSRSTGNMDNIGNMVPVQLETLGSDTVIVVDSLTQISHSAMAKALGGWDDENLKPEFKHYTAQGFYLDRFLTAMQNSRANWLIISHEESIEQEDGNEKIVPMAGTRNFSKTSARYFDHVVYCSIGNYKYQAYSSGLDDMSVLAGSRTNVNIKNNSNLDKLVEIFTPREHPAPGTPVQAQAAPTTGSAALAAARAKALAAAGKTPTA